MLVEEIRDNDGLGGDSDSVNVEFKDDSEEVVSDESELSEKSLES